MLMIVLMSDSVSIKYATWVGLGGAAETLSDPLFFYIYI